VGDNCEEDAECVIEYEEDEDAAEARAAADSSFHFVFRRSYSA